ncbi:unnamed protein product, partial [Porites lobata]
MASSVPSVLVLGHPFIRRLRDDLRLHFDSRADDTLGLSDDAIVHLHGVGGLTVARLLRDLGMVSSLSPQVVILELGTNDLTRLRPEVAGSEIEDLVVLSGPVGLCNDPGPPVSLLGAVMGLTAIPKGCFTLARLLHVNFLPVAEFGPFRRLTAAVTMPPRRSTRSKRPSNQALESLGASPPRRRRTAAPSLPSSGNDSETAAQSAVLLSGPSSHASEPAIPTTGPAFPPALFDQLVQRVAAEVTRQLQPASLLPAVQEPQVPSPPPAAFPSLAGTTAVQQLTTEVPVVSSSPVGNPSAVDQVTQVVQSVHSSLAGSSLNDGISSDYSTVSYATVKNAIGLIKSVGPNCFLAKTDVKNAFRLVPIRPEDYDLLGIYWQGQYYYDSFLGIPMAPEKTVGPSTTLAFAGIELDTVLMEARLPQEKLDKCRDLLSTFLRRRKV